MNKNELIKKVAEKSDCSAKQVGIVINQVLEEIQASVAAGDPVALAGFGTFDVKHREARHGRNPATGETIVISHVLEEMLQASVTAGDPVALAGFGTLETIEIAASSYPVFKPAKAFKDKVNG